MVIPVNITDLRNRRIVESTRVESKNDWNPKPILHSICAFADDIDNQYRDILLDEQAEPVEYEMTHIMM